MDNPTVRRFYMAWVVTDNFFYAHLKILDVGFQDGYGYEAGLSEKAKSSTVQFNC